MNHWNEIRTAAHVARLGTISAASAVLGVHRVTVTRHVDLLETFFGRKLFLRHARGFTPTEFGLELLRVADTTDEQFDQLMRKSTELSGQLVVTSVEAIAVRLVPVLNAFRETFPNVRTQLLSSDTVIDLKYGQAHIGFRVGQEPNDPDCVVSPFKTLQMTLYASAEYVSRNGIPITERDFNQHVFVGSQSPNPRARFLRWMNANIPKENIGFTSNNISILTSAVLSGAGIGFLPTVVAESNSSLIQVLPPRPEWEVPTWIVTHVDLHRSRKVQAFLDLLKTT